MQGEEIVSSEEVEESELDLATEEIHEYRLIRAEIIAMISGIGNVLLVYFTIV